MSIELEKVRRMASRCDKKSELIEMRANCLSKKNLEAVDVCENELDTRFPNWESPDVVRIGQGVAVPTKARFRNHTEKLPSQIEAYIWLLNQFAASNPNAFKPNGKDDSTYGRLLFGHREEWAMHFAPESKLIDFNRNGAPTGARSIRLDCGWWANTTLSRPQKLRLLERLAQHCGIKPDEWAWEPDVKYAPMRTAQAKAQNE